ncbi:Agamous-like MADS-box protein AGL3 [Linum perenne]
MSSAAPTGMMRTIEKYQRYTYGQLEPNQLSKESDEDNYQDYLKLKEEVEVLKRTQRHLLGEELGNLGARELDQLENQLDGSLKQIRLIKTQSIADQLSNLKQKSWQCANFREICLKKQTRP